jgi:HEAT repeat protein
VLQDSLGTTAVTDVHVTSLQQIAAISLGWMDKEAAASVLYPLLQSENGSVRVAAAMSLLRIFKDFRPMAPALPQAAPQTQPAKASGSPGQPARSDKPDDPSLTKGETTTRPDGRKRPKLHTAGGKD